MICAKRDEFFEDYRRGVERLATAVLALRAGRRTADFDAAYQESERVWSECERARRELEEHRAQHGC